MIALLDSPVFGGLFGVDRRMADVFADSTRIADLLAVEAALARAEAAVGVISGAAAERIGSAAATLRIDVEALRASIDVSGVPTIEVVRQLREAVGPETAASVHHGATSQDVVDTATILALRRATLLIEEHLKQVATTLMDLADRYRGAVMAGRTHGQQAAPITFGLKAANWLAPLPRHWVRLRELKPRVFAVQFGGAAGNLGALGALGPAVLQELARQLDLAPLVPWHTQRDAIVEYGSWLAMVAGSLAKIGQDVILLTQTEVAEVHESADVSHGGSSAMPHKRNPIASEMVVAGARAVVALLSGLHAAAIQEHERSTHGWQLEWLVLPQMVALTYGLARHSAFVTTHLRADTARMRTNLSNAGDVVLAESLAMMLAERMGLQHAHAFIRRAALEDRPQHQSLVQTVRQMAVQAGIGDEIDWNRVGDAGAHLGATDAFIERILTDARSIMC